MKKKLLISLLLILTVISAMVFSSCSKTVTLESYVGDHPEVQQSIDDAMGSSDVVVEIKDNEIIYSYDLSKMEGYTEELVKNEQIITALTDALAAAGSTFGNISKTIEDTTEIKGIQTTVNYTWADEVIVTQTFTAADAE